MSRKSVATPEPSHASVVTRALRALLSRVRSLYASIGLLLAIGLALAGTALFGFFELAEGVLEGETQAFDDAVLRWIHAHAPPWTEPVALEVTRLGETLVLTLLTAVCALLLRLAAGRFAAWLMVAAFAGGAILNTLLKQLFARDRPEIFTNPADAVSTSSFPSGHAMLSMVTYATLAWLILHQGPPRSARIAVPLVAGLLVLLIGASRLFLGVHYPSDVLAGYAVGFAWATFCAATAQSIRSVHGSG